MTQPPTASLAERYIRWVVAHPRQIWAVLALVTIASLVSLTHIRFRFSPADFYDYEGNAALPALKTYEHDFRDAGNLITLIVEAEDVFAPEVLRYIASITESLEPEPTFKRVLSLTTATLVRPSPDGVTAGRLFPTIPDDKAAIEPVRRAALESALLSGRLVSKDGKVTVIVAEVLLDKNMETTAQKRAAMAAARRTMSQHPAPAGVKTSVAGGPVLELELTDLLIQDQMVLIPAATLLIFAALFFIFRSLAGALLPLVTVVMAVIWSAGVVPFLGRPINMVSATFPIVLLVYGAVDPIFVLSRYLGKLAKGQTREEALIASFRELLLPCMLTSVTTALGFAAFATMELPIVVSYGVISAVGVMLAFVTTATTLPLLLLKYTPPVKGFDSSAMGERLDRFFARLWPWLSGHRWAVLGTSLLALGVGAYASSRLEVSTIWVDMLPAGEVRDAIKTLDHNLSGVYSTVVVVDGPPGSMRRPEVLKAIAQVEAAARASTIKPNAIAVTDLLAEINRAFMDGDPKEEKVPASTALVAQYLSLLNPADRDEFLDASDHQAQISIIASDIGTRYWRTLREDVEASMAKAFPGPEVTAHITGLGQAFSVAADQTVTEMLTGFIVGFLIIVLFELILLRSLRFALISILPNVIPALACFTIFAVGGITLRIGTMVFLSVSIGALFNTTIHLGVRVMQRLKETDDGPDEVLAHSLSKVMPASLFTAAVLSLGFSTFIFSRFWDLRAIGISSMAIFLIGFVSDLMLTPVLLRLFFNWKRPPVAAAVSATTASPT